MDSFNSYIDGIDRNFLEKLCREKGKAVHYRKGEYFVEAGQQTQHIAYVRKGHFTYIAHNKTESKDYIISFVFQGEFVAEYPHCMYQLPASITIRAATPCDVYQIEAEELTRLFAQPAYSRYAQVFAEQLFLQVYSRLIDVYAKTPEERYLELQRRHPQLFQTLSLKEIALFLRVTPATISNIRKRFTFGE